MIDKTHRLLQCGGQHTGGRRTTAVKAALVVRAPGADVKARCRHLLASCRVKFELSSHGMSMSAWQPLAWKGVSVAGISVGVRYVGAAGYTSVQLRRKVAVGLMHEAHAAVHYAHQFVLTVSTCLVDLVATVLMQ